MVRYEVGKVSWGYVVGNNVKEFDFYFVSYQSYEGFFSRRGIGLRVKFFIEIIYGVYVYIRIVGNSLVSWIDIIIDKENYYKV